jgi:hypothetical protein
MLPRLESDCINHLHCLGALSGNGYLADMMANWQITHYPQWTLGDHQQEQIETREAILVSSSKSITFSATEHLKPRDYGFVEEEP